MAKNHVKEGKTMTWPNDTGSPVVSGEVVPMADMIGVALGDIDDTKEGELATEEIWELPKEAALALSAGDRVYWDVANSNIDATNTNVAAGVVWKDALAADPTVWVKINA